MGTSTNSGVGRNDPAAKTELRHLNRGESDDLDRARRDERTQKILEDANDRDDEAEARDAVADERARVADREAFTDPESTYPGPGERRAAAQDRADSKVTVRLQRTTAYA